MRSNGFLANGPRIRSLPPLDGPDGFRCHPDGPNGPRLFDADDRAQTREQKKKNIKERERPPGRRPFGLFHGKNPVSIKAKHKTFCLSEHRKICSKKISNRVALRLTIHRTILQINHVFPVKRIIGIFPSLKICMNHNVWLSTLFNFVFPIAKMYMIFYEIIPR